MIIRSNHSAQERFFLLRRATAQDARLSARALGVLTYLLSKPDGWEVSVTDLKKHFNDLGRDAAYAVLNELISLGYACRTRERDPKTGTLGHVRIDIHELPLTAFQDVASPLPEIPDLGNPHPDLPDLAKPEHIRNRGAEETEQQKKQSSSSKGKQTAAAAASSFNFETIRQFVIATKPHSKNPGGLAKHLLRTGEEDAEIQLWQSRQHRKSEDLNQTPFDPWTRQQHELAAREAERRWLASLDGDFYTHAFREAAEEFQRRFPQHARTSNWQTIHKSAIETLIITNYYREEIAA